MMAFARMKDRFTARNTALLGLSTDSSPSHIAWIRAIGGTSWNGIDRPRIDFPIVADHQGGVARQYGMLMPMVSPTQTVRSVFVIDPKGTIRAVQFYPMTTGRSTEEIYRLVAALQTTDSSGNPTPANWQPGQQAVLPHPSTLPMAEQATSGANGCGALDWCLRETPANRENSPANAKSFQANAKSSPANRENPAVSPSVPVPNQPAAKENGAVSATRPVKEPPAAKAAPAPAKRAETKAPAAPPVPLMPDIADLIRIVNGQEPIGPMRPAPPRPNAPQPNVPNAPRANAPEPNIPMPNRPAANSGASMPDKMTADASNSGSGKETCDSPVPGRPFRPEPQPEDPRSIAEQNRTLLNWSLSNTGKSGGGAAAFDEFFHKK